MSPETAALSATLRAASVEAEVSEEKLGTIVRISSADIGPALVALRDGDFSFAFMVDLLAMDTGEAVELTYHLRSFTRDEEIFVRCELPYGGQADSVWRVFPAALYPEREIAELFGVSFPGHPNPKRLLTTDEVEAPLLLKSVAIRTDEEVHDR